MYISMGLVKQREAGGFVPPPLLVGALKLLALFEPFPVILIAEVCGSLAPEVGKQRWYSKMGLRMTISFFNQNPDLFGQ